MSGDVLLTSLVLIGMLLAACVMYDRAQKHKAKLKDDRVG